MEKLANGEQVVVDYRYLGSSNSKLYAGVDQQDDVIGKLIYTWEPVDELGNKRSLDSGNESTGWTSSSGFTTDKTQDYRYKLVIRYVPAVIDSVTIVTLPDQTTTTLAARITELAEYVPSNNVVFPGSNEITKPPLGTTVSEKTTSSYAVIHVVDGRIHLQKEVDKETLIAYLDGLKNNENLQFEFHLKKDQTEDYRKVTLKLVKSGTATNLSGIDTTASAISITLTKDSVAGMATDADGLVDLISLWMTSLPKGDYILSETVSGDDYVLDSITPVSDYYEQTYPTQQDLAKYLAQSNPAVGSAGTNTVTWYMGRTPVNTTQQYADCKEGNNEFPITKVVDLAKEVDPSLSLNSGKIYLNAQIGEAVIRNRLLSGGFTIDKLDAKNNSLALDGVEFTLYKATVQGTVWTKGEQVGDAKTTTKNPGESHAYAKFNGLRPGKYLLYETAAKPGYNLPENPWKVTVTKTQNDEIVVSITDYDGTQISLSEEVITLTNEPGVELPSTGGPGTKLIYLIGLISVFIASAGLVISRSQRREAA